MELITVLFIGALLGSLLGLVAGFAFPQVRHGALWCFLACVGLAWLRWTFYCGGLLDTGSLFGLCCRVLMRISYGAIIGSLAPAAYRFAQFLVTRTGRPRPPA